MARNKAVENIFASLGFRKTSGKPTVFVLDQSGNTTRKGKRATGKLVRRARRLK